MSAVGQRGRSEEHTSGLQSRRDLVCRLLLEKKPVDPVKECSDLRAPPSLRVLRVCLCRSRPSALSARPQSILASGGPLVLALIFQQGAAEVAALGEAADGELGDLARFAAAA